MHNALFLVDDLSYSTWQSLFQSALNFSSKKDLKVEGRQKSVGLIFLEPSSRTKWSFAKACLDTGVSYYDATVDGTSSLSKGESLVDTFELFLNLSFDLVVFRSSSDQQLLKKLSDYQMPFINAGFGSEAHPTQAFLDAFTWFEKGIPHEDVRMLIIGDVAHSRVASSHFRFSKIMGYQVGTLSPPNMGPSGEQIRNYDLNEFSDRKSAIEWANIVYVLRAQKERHGKEDFESFDPLSGNELRKDHIVMHPGPFMRNEDLEGGLVHDSRSLIFQQKKNGVFCRAALLSHFLWEGREIWN